MTTVADGLYQYGGVPVGVNPLYNKIFYNPYASYKKGRSWFVDASQSASGNGKSPAQAFVTMDEAFDKINSGDIIYAIGNIREQLVTPVQVFDVTVVGCGNRPRNADADPEGGGYAAVTWRAPASGGTAAQATIRVLQQGWTFVNILFGAIDSDAAMVELVRNAGSGDDERDASHAQFVGCRFGGAGKGIRLGATSFTENVFNVLVDDCKFNSCTFGIYNTTGSQPNSCMVRNSWFQGCTNAITAQFQASTIQGCTIQGFTAASNSGGIDVRGGGSNNIITKNYLAGTYSKAGGYNCESGDEWAGNFNTLAGGITVSDPA